VLSTSTITSPRTSVGAKGSPSTSAASVAPTLVEIADYPGGRIVIDGAGHPLYVSDSDPVGGMPACNGSCTTLWSPLLLPFGSHASGGTALSGLLGSVRRADGSMQVTLRGRPLYRYVNDPPGGNVTGDGFGGIWHVARPS
jgi:predicted lipoprotein with Yx(FWY)xxD motif